MPSAAATRPAAPAGPAASGRRSAGAGRGGGPLPARPPATPRPAGAREVLRPGVWKRDASTAALAAAHVRRLGAYMPDGGAPARDVLQLTTVDLGVLVLDCVAGTLTDALLVAHLAPDEPAGNARVVSDLYLADATRGRCRRLSAADLQQEHPMTPPAFAGGADVPADGLRDTGGRLYQIREVQSTPPLLELRWTCLDSPDSHALFALVTLRDVIGAIESYEPASAITHQALAAGAHANGVSTDRLRHEAERVDRSPIVLNRGLRECVERHLSCGVSMSEIATRCGRTKRDRRGNRSGETTWLARRIGQMPEGGETEPTPWVHSDTLALIARDGLGVSPREVEL